MAKVLHTNLVSITSVPNDSEVVYSVPFYKTQYYLGSETTIFGLFETKVPHVDTNPIFSSFVGIFEREIFKGSPENSFEDALKRLNSEMEKIGEFAENREISENWFSSYGAVVGIIVGDTLLVSSVGSAAVYLGRDSYLEKISSEEPGTEFAVVNTGELEKSDKVIVLSSGVDLSINAERLRIATGSKRSEKLVELLHSTEKSLNENGVGIGSSVIFECDEKDVPDGIVSKSFVKTSSEKDSGKTSSKESKSGDGLSSYLEKIKTFFAENLPKVKGFLISTGKTAKIYLLKLKEKALSGEPALKSSGKNKDEKSGKSTEGLSTNGFNLFEKKNFSKDEMLEFLKFRWLSTFGKIFVVAIFSLLLLVSLTFCRSQNSKEEHKDQQDQEQIAKEIRANIISVDTLILTDQKEKAKITLSETRDILEGLDDGSLKDGFKEDLNELEMKIEGVSEVDGTLVADFKTVDGDPDTFEFVGSNEIYAFGTDAIYNLRTDTVPAAISKLEIDTTGLGKVLLSTKSEDEFLIILYTQAGDVWNFDYRNKTLEKATLPDGLSWPSATAIDSYSVGTQTVLYILTPQDNQIKKYFPTTTGYDRPTDYIKGSVDLTGAKSISIDGGIYISFEDGRVEYYFGGDKTAVNDLKSISSLLKSGEVKAFAETGIDSVYVYDPEKSLVAVLTSNNGNLTQVKNLGVEGTVAGKTLEKFYPHENGGKVYLLLGNKIYFVGLN